MNSVRTHYLSFQAISVRIFVGTIIVFAAIERSKAFSFNPFKPIGDIAGKAVEAGTGAMRSVGSFLGAGPGGFIGAATAPAIDQAEGAGHKLISDADNRFANRITQLDAVGTKQIGALDLALDKRIQQADATIKQRIDQVDGVLKLRIDQVNGVLDSTIVEVDDILQKHIDDLDEIAGKRIGNLDVVATKASLTFESAATRLVGIVCLMVFCAAAIWRAYVELSNAPGVPARASWWTRLKAMEKSAGIRVLAELSVAAIGLFCLYGLFALLPGGPARRIRQLANLHSRALEDSLSVLDIRQATFHAAQLQMLDPLSNPYRGEELKTDLIRDIFSRPTTLQTLAGVNGVVLHVNQVEAMLGENTDPDVQVVKAIVRWRMGPTKGDEYSAAVLCADALRARSGKDFALRSFALEYLEDYLENPISERLLSDVPKHETFQQLKSTFDEEQKLLDPRDARPTPLAYVFKYNKLVRNLTKVSAQAYIQMLDAHADYKLATDAAAKTAAKDKRQVAAKNVGIAWKDFIDNIEADELVRGTSAPLAAMLLNDAVQARAFTYMNAPDDAHIPEGRLLTDTERSAASTDLCRLKIYSRHAQGVLAKGTIDMIDFQEYHRFMDFDSAMKDFEANYLSFRNNVLSSAGSRDIVKSGYEAAICAGIASFVDHSTDGTAHSLSETILTQMNEKIPGGFIEGDAQAKVIRDSKQADLNIGLNKRNNQFL